MKQNSNELLEKMRFLVGNAEIVMNAEKVPALQPFNERVLEFLNYVSKVLMYDYEIRQYSDIVTWGFWIRKSSTEKLKARFVKDDKNIRMGRGCIFHIAPSNVPINYAYSLVSGLLTGNVNIVKLPSKDFPQVRIVNNAIKKALNKFEDLKPYVCLVNYNHDKKINDFLSEMVDTRIIWGGDLTINEIRKSPIASRTNEITFADRYSIAIIDSNVYMNEKEKERIAEEFYNDTYLTDQNACTSPKMVVWLGDEKEKAKEQFWSKIHEFAKTKYQFQPIMSVDKLMTCCLSAVYQSNIRKEKTKDNLVVRINVSELTKDIMDYAGNSGCFFEYDCDDILEIKQLCNNKKCQTIAYMGSKEEIKLLLSCGIKGVDRVVPIGKTMDFDLIWDGYNLFENLTRTVRIDI